MKYLWAGAAIVGVIAIVFGVIWMTVIFPKLERIPADFSRTDHITGQYTIVDPIVSQVQANAAIKTLMASPNTVAMFKDPTVQLLLTNPTFVQLMANPTQLIQLITNPAALAQVPDASLKQALASPSIQKLLTDPAILGLFRDPNAMKLVLDTRVMPMLFDPTALPTVVVPVNITRDRKATGVDGNKILLHEKITILRVDNGQPLEGYPETNANLVVDRHTSEYLPGTDGGRTGHLGLPFNPDPSVTYPMWSTVASATLDAKYVSDDTLDGLKVMVYRINVMDRPLGDDPTLKLPKVMDSNLTIWVEPHSGRIVDVRDNTTSVSLVRPSGKLAVYVSDYKLADDSKALQISEGKNDRTTLLWLGAYMPWIVVGVGIVLAVAGATGVAWTMKPKAQAAGAPEQPHH